jgi:hypothetical protein
MHLNRFDRTFLLGLGLVLVALCFFASCTTQSEWEAAGLSTRLEYELGSGDLDSRGGKAHNDVDYQALTVSIAPFQLWAWKAQADINALAIIEKRYAERPPPMPVKPEPKVEPPK